MPRKKRADVREILRKRMEEPETANDIADALLSFLNAPDKAKAADVLKLIDFTADNAKADAKAEAVTLPEPDEDLSAYADAQLWDWLKRLEGGKARAP